LIHYARLNVFLAAEVFQSHYGAIDTLQKMDTTTRKEIFQSHYGAIDTHP